MIPVVLSGGSGTRLWPLSRLSFPKQFCDLVHESLLEKTIKRLKPLGSPWTLTTNELDILTGRVFRTEKIPLQQIVYEPTGRNTAPAIALLCRILEMSSRENEIVGIFPADHLVLKETEFLQAIALAVSCAEAGQIATLGIKPNYPATGFGYIETLPEAFKTDGPRKAFAVKSFREKPDEETAQRFLQDGHFSWNAGIFVFKASLMISSFKEHAPEIWRVISELKPDQSNLREVYAKVPSVSIDYAIMEKVRSQVCIPADIGWSDLGSWDDVANLTEMSGLNTSNKAVPVAVLGTNNFTFSSHPKVIATVAVDDLIVVDTPDALLITRRGQSQNVRLAVEELKKLKNPAATEHRFELRPWGLFEIIRDDDTFKAKIIRVEAGAQISYQSHAKRSEHWIIVKGQGEVILDSQTIPVKPGASVFIPQGAKHRIHNTGSSPLEFIEVQTGTYFGEDDIVRYQDDYNRV